MFALCFFVDAFGPGQRTYLVLELRQSGYVVVVALFADDGSGGVHACRMPWGKMDIFHTTK